MFSWFTSKFCGMTKPYVMQWENPSHGSILHITALIPYESKFQALELFLYEF